MQLQKIWCIAAVLLITMAAGTGCAYTKKDLLSLPCTLPDTVFYARDIVPVMQANCYSCHGSASNSSGILLDSYDALSAYAANGYLYGTISHASGYRPMPDNGRKLSDCTIAQIKKWIDSGRPR